MKEDNYACFNFLINFKDNEDPEAWYRILEAFIMAVEKEGACTGGGMHALGSVVTCETCKDEQEIN